MHCNWLIAPSLSARRAWIEIGKSTTLTRIAYVALRKESVDRNGSIPKFLYLFKVALRKESVDRNHAVQIIIVKMHGRSPQGERG